MNNQHILKNIESAGMDELKATAKLFGIKFSNNIGLEKLRNKLKDEISLDTPYAETEYDVVKNQNEDASVDKQPVAEKANSKDKEYPSEMTDVVVPRLPVWVQVSNLNASEQEEPTVFRSVGNEDWIEAWVVPFNKPFRVPYCIAKDLEAAEYQSYVPEISESGKLTGNMVSKRVRHYHVQYL
jgi:hypothetical protein